MQQTKDLIFSEIDMYIMKNEGDYPRWYIGITSNPNKTLFETLKLDKKTDKYIYRQCSNSGVAHDIRKFFIDLLKADGDIDQGDYNCEYIYAFRKTSNTNE